MVKHTIKQRGIGLLELMLSLAIISVLLVMATRYYRTTKQNQQVNDAIAQVQAMVAASENWVIGRNDFTGISLANLIASGNLPDGSQFNPWHAQNTVRKASNPNHIIIAMNGLPQSACYNMAEKLNRHTATPQTNPHMMCTGIPATFYAEF